MVAGEKGIKKLKKEWGFIKLVHITGSPRDLNISLGLLVGDLNFL